MLTLAPIPDQTFGNPPILLHATSRSPAPITYSVIGGCHPLGELPDDRESGDSDHLRSPGGKRNLRRYRSTGSFNVAPEVIPVTFGAIPAKSFSKSGPFVVRATSAAYLPDHLLRNSGPATISGSTVNLTGPGM